jgi:hypothetical protein
LFAVDRVSAAICHASSFRLPGGLASLFECLIGLWQRTNIDLDGVDAGVMAIKQLQNAWCRSSGKSVSETYLQSWAIERPEKQYH